MDFSKLKLNEGLAQGMGAMSSLNTSQSTSQLAKDSAMDKANRANISKTRKTNMSSQALGTKQKTQTMMNSFDHLAAIQQQKAAIKKFNETKSDWRTELQEKVIDGREEDNHPYVSVMPTGDENLMQAIKQMRGEVDKKKEKAQGQMAQIGEQKEEDRSDAMPKGDVGHDIHKKSVEGFKKRNPSYKLKKEETELLDEKKKGCKDGYYRDEDGDCVKKKKKGSSIIVGRGWGYGHHHHNDDENDDGSNADNGSDAGDGGGGMGEMFDVLGDLLLQEKEMTLRDAQKSGMTKGTPFESPNHRKLNAQRVKDYIAPKTSNKDRAKD